ncbi:MULTISPECIES: RNA polymerase sigma factor [Actinomadura]|uniref:Sigma-70 family RNA polymerase sigma factor n=1 Tax=Actinomadura litoris TaxID=2678616 RepID=A0A7K1KVA1_9ACTN|nr:MULTISPECIES: sigma-70 family RNA polymerase sigma factor [Actinomadura]MBT2211044.1 sigma-70 family RNA polymerase sigma factor [Actinomadura sp. NEAU-AAG7]MUN35965.1 sigma-70 family RNA polymerase sigma factor [Actinomadura litoris]
MALQDGTDELMDRARDGDGAAWARLVERYSGMLWAIARGHGLGDADSGDVVQTTWLRLVERMDGLRSPAAVGAWLATTARHESARLAARAARDLPPLVVAAPEAAPDQVVLARERLGQVATAIATLPRRCQVLLRMVAQNAGQADLAAALRIPVGSVGPTRARCLETLRGLVR